MKKIVKFLAFVLVLMLVATEVQAQGNRYKEKNRDRDWGSSNNTVGRWEKIGTQTVQKSSEKDDFRPSSRKSYSALKVMVRKNTVNFNKMTIYFENGQKQDIELRNIIKDGGESRIINLLHKRRIDKIRFEYRTRNLIGSRAEVDVWARS